MPEATRVSHGEPVIHGSRAAGAFVLEILVAVGRQGRFRGINLGCHSPSPPPHTLGHRPTREPLLVCLHQDSSELRAVNLRLRGVIADMRREMEALRDPSSGAGKDTGGSSVQHSLLGESKDGSR